MPKLNEREIISIFSRRLGIRDLDDVAPVGRKNVLKCDMLVASTDVPPGMEAWQVARKSVVACASDLAAKGATPVAAMISLGIPEGTDRKFVSGLGDGFARASKEFQVKIVGGDTNKANDLVIDCCMLGTMRQKRPRRSGAKEGDVVVVSGPFGLPPAGLAILLNGCQAEREFEKRAIRSVMEPAPCQRFGTALAQFFSSSIDSSDGLAISLHQIASNSHVDIEIDRAPSVDGIERFAARNKLDSKELVFYGGEEYEIVATIPEKDFKKMTASAEKVGVRVYPIGRTKRGSGNVRLGKSTLENRGYVHFQPR